MLGAEAPCPGLTGEGGAGSFFHGIEQLLHILGSEALILSAQPGLLG